MRAQVILAATAPQVIAQAQAIADGAPDAVSLASKLRAWLQLHAIFTPDPDNVELVRTPVEQLRQIAYSGTMRGDCDDVATLGAALAKALGLRVRFVVLGFDGVGGAFQHVYAQLYDAGVKGWREFTDYTRTRTTAPAQRVAVMEV